TSSSNSMRRYFPRRSTDSTWWPVSVASRSASDVFGIMRGQSTPPTRVTRCPIKRGRRLLAVDSTSGNSGNFLALWTEMRADTADHRLVHDRGLERDRPAAQFDGKVARREPTRQWLDANPLSLDELRHFGLRHQVQSRKLADVGQIQH